MRAYKPSLDALRSAVGVQLDEFLAARRRAVPESAGLIDEIGSVIAAGGKRLRPAFCYWGHRACGGGDSEEIVRAASSLELLHTFAIVHDDIMDDSDERRGEPTVHVRGGIGLALLVGDLALVLADELLLKSGFRPDSISRAFDAYSLMRQEVIAGQHMDLVATEHREVSEDAALRIAVLKSGRYSIEKPLVIGALLAGAADDLVHGLSRYGDPLGEAFQVRDDLLGTFGARADTGKPVDSDIREGKRNVLFATTTRLLTGAEHEFFVDRWGADDLNDAEIRRLRSLVESSGARAATENLLRKRAAAAYEALQSLPVDEAARRALVDLTHLATDRDV